MTGGWQAAEVVESVCSAYLVSTRGWVWCLETLWYLVRFGDAMDSHHRLCDWNIARRAEFCTCGLLNPKPQWFDAYVRGIEKQATNLRCANALPDIPTSVIEE